MSSQAKPCKPLEVTDVELKAISDPLYKAGVKVLLRYNILRLAEEEDKL